jgi:hypothetical protein
LGIGNVGGLGFFVVVDFGVERVLESYLSVVRFIRLGIVAENRRMGRWRWRGMLAAMKCIPVQVGWSGACFFGGAARWHDERELA